MQTLCGLESLADSHFPRKYISADVRVDKSTVAYRPSTTDTVPPRPNEVWHMDTIGPTKTIGSATKHHSLMDILFYRTVMPHLLKFRTVRNAGMQIYLVFRELHGEPRIFRCDNAPVNVSRRATSFRETKGIRTETIRPSESHQNGTADHIHVIAAQTVLLAIGLERR